MLFIGRTMNKETTEQKKERKGERGREKQGSPRILWNLTVITESIPCKRVRLKVFSSPFSDRAASLRIQSCWEKFPRSPGAVMSWYRCCGCARFGASPLLKAGVTVQYSYSAIWAIWNCPFYPVVGLAYSLTASPPLSKCALKMCSY